MEFVLTKPKSKSEGWTNLLHFTCFSDCKKIGDRIPGKTPYFNSQGETIDSTILFSSQRARPKS